MPRWGSIAFDIAAITVLAVVVYFPRYRRRDLLFAYVAVNIGVMAVTIALTETVIGVAVGLGLFGVLSIVRLRSAELAQQEVAYYFAALAPGSARRGRASIPRGSRPTLSALIVLALVIADHPRLFARYRNQIITLDRAFTDEHELTVAPRDACSTPMFVTF